MKNKKILKFLIFIFTMGILFGLLFKFYLNDNDLLIIKSEINDYIILITKESINKVNLFNNLLYNIFLLILIFISGIIFIFLPILFIIIFSKGFSFGFLIVSLCSLYKFKGIIYAFILLMPFQIITIFILLITSYYSINVSKKLINYFFYKKEIDIRKLLISYFKIFLILSIILIINNILEVYLVPLIMKLIV